jgi:hypothetical protein
MIGKDKARIWLTLDKDVLTKAKEYATRQTLSSMVNKMLADALGMEPRELRARLPKIDGEDEEE